MPRLDSAADILDRTFPLGRFDLYFFSCDVHSFVIRIVNAPFVLIRVHDGLLAPAVPPTVLDCIHDSICAELNAIRSVANRTIRLAMFRGRPSN